MMDNVIVTKEVAVLVSNAWLKHPHLMGQNIMTTAGTADHEAILADFKAFLELDLEEWRKALFLQMIDALEASL